jgi:hypothetical protein
MALDAGAYIDTRTTDDGMSPLLTAVLWDQERMVDSSSSQARYSSAPRTTQQVRPREDHNNNRRSLVSGSNSHCRPWYVENPDKYEKGHRNYLCETCCHINLEYLFHPQAVVLGEAPAPSEEYICLGPLPEMIRESSCKLCYLVATTIQIRIGSGTDQTSDGAQRQRLLEATWFLSPSVYTHEQYGVGFQLFLRPDVFEKEQRNNNNHTHPSYPFGLRLITNEAPRGGRAVPPLQLDFEWIRQTIDLCELSTDMPAPHFDHPIRVIDVINMCVGDLPNDGRYVALSYPWGNAKQITLTRQNKAVFQEMGGLLEVFSQLLQTIQDAMVLVGTVKERYLSVLSHDLCADLPAYPKQVSTLLTLESVIALDGPR